MKNKRAIFILIIILILFSACDQLTSPPVSSEDDTSGGNSVSSPYEIIDIYNVNHTCHTNVLTRGDIGSGILDDDYKYAIGEIEDASLSASRVSPYDEDYHHYTLAANAVSDENRVFSAISHVHSWGDVSKPVQTNTYLAESDITSNIYFKAVSSSSSTSSIDIEINVSVDAYMECDWPDTNVNAQSYFDFDAGVSPLSETMPDYGSRTIYLTNDSLAGIQGFARVGFEDGASVAGSGFLFANQFTHLEDETDYGEYLSADPQMSFATTPGQPLELGFIIQTSAEISFIGDGSGGSRIVEALAELENLEFTITASDPDNPSAVITIEYFIPEAGSGGFTI